MATIKDKNTGEPLFQTETEKGTKAPEKQLRKRGIKPFDFLITWGKTKIKCQNPQGEDNEMLKAKQRELLQKVEQLQAEDREKQATRKKQELEQKAAAEAGEVLEAVPSTLLTDLENALTQGNKIAQLKANYAYLVVFKFVVGWDNGPWDWNKETWENDVFDLEPEDVQQLSNEIIQNSVMSEAEADFLANRSFL